MTKYREILRLKSLNFSERNIAQSVPCSRNTVSKVLKKALEKDISVGVMTYSQYVFAEAFINEKQRAWIAAHVHMYDYFGGVAKILVPDNL